MNPKSELPQSGFVSPRWVKDRYGISNSTLYKWLSEDYLPQKVRIGARTTRFRVEDLREFEAKLMKK